MRLEALHRAEAHNAFSKHREHCSSWRYLYEISLVVNEMVQIIDVQPPEGRLVRANGGETRKQLKSNGCSGKSIVLILK